MPQKNLAQNDTIELERDVDRSCVAAMSTGSGNHAGAVVVIEVQGCKIDDEYEYITIGLFDAINQAAAANLTGASKYGWTDCPGDGIVRCRRTDANVGDCVVNFDMVRV